MSIFISFITEANYRQTFYAIRGNRNETRNIFFQKKNKNTKSSIFTTRLLPAFFLPPNLIHFIHDRHFRLLFTRKRSIQLFLSGRKTRWIDISDAKNNNNDSSFVTIIQGLKFPKDRAEFHSAECEERRWKASRCWSVNSTAKKRRRRRRRRDIAAESF